MTKHLRSCYKIILVVVVKSLLTFKIVFLISRMFYLTSLLISNATLSVNVMLMTLSNYTHEKQIKLGN